MQDTISLKAPSARHPFRQAFVESRIARARDRDDSDVRLFALSFGAFFICFYTFIF
ncbi:MULTISPECIES: hypothetical protein [Sphingomonas]|uniref:Uncharacterized protein n=1 Tax=Sphingomonas glacialis TaxID=658225 RepID=A0ABQ3LCZ9_9SPHN|nr:MULTISPECIES: hypothetical protein [Sphingomonas]GHH09184.1 hypothetical protein GCM10008023_05500 [Sphingomonas glacialis]